MGERNPTRNDQVTTDAEHGKTSLPVSTAAEAPSEDAGSTESAASMTRRSYLATAAGVAGLAAAPAARAASTDQYGDGEYGAGSYGGVSS